MMQKKRTNGFIIKNQLTNINQRHSKIDTGDDIFMANKALEKWSLRDLKKGIDLTFKDFSREYGDSIDGFFGPLLKFLVWFEIELRMMSGAGGRC